MKILSVLAVAIGVLATAMVTSPETARAGGYYVEDVDVGIVAPIYDPLPYGVYKATHYRRHHYDYGRYWWYYDPYAYYGGHYGYHPRRWRPAYSYGPRYGYKKRWKQRRRHWK
jgi:hypothetical protein